MAWMTVTSGHWTFFDWIFQMDSTPWQTNSDGASMLHRTIEANTPIVCPLIDKCPMIKLRVVFLCVVWQNQCKKNTLNIKKSVAILPFYFILYIFLMLYICRSLVWKLCWPGFWWIFAKHTTCVFIFWSIQKYSQFWLPREKNTETKKHHSLQRENNSTVIKEKKKNLLSLSKFTLSNAQILQTPTSRTADLKAWKYFWHATRETAASGGAENPFLFSFFLFFFFLHQTRRASSQSLRACISKLLTLQMSAPHHCENWCFWAVQSGVEHIRVQDISEHSRAQRGRHIRRCRDQICTIWRSRIYGFSQNCFSHCGD